jgi:uncharacterized membrane protein YkoI
MFRLGLALVVAVMWTSVASAEDPGAKVTDFKAALSIAQGEVPNAQLIRARIEQKKSVQVFGFYFWLEGRVYEVEVNKRGKVVKKTTGEIEDVSEDVVKLVDKQKNARAKLPDGRLMEIASDALKNTPLSNLQYEKDGDKLVLRIGDLVIDAATGKILSSK